MHRKFVNKRTCRSAFARGILPHQNSWKRLVFEFALFNKITETYHTEEGSIRLLNFSRQCHNFFPIKEGLNLTSVQNGCYTHWTLDVHRIWKRLNRLVKLTFSSVLASKIAFKVVFLGWTSLVMRKITHADLLKETLGPENPEASNKLCKAAVNANPPPKR